MTLPVVQFQLTIINLLSTTQGLKWLVPVQRASDRL